MHLCLQRKVVAIATNIQAWGSSLQFRPKTTTYKMAWNPESGAT